MYGIAKDLQTWKFSGVELRLEGCVIVSDSYGLQIHSCLRQEAPLPDEYGIATQEIVSFGGGEFEGSGLLWGLKVVLSCS